MICIHFIVNPISGNGKHLLTNTFLRQHFPVASFNIKVEHTKYKNHAITLTKKAITENPDYIVACGGDGTINEVASSMIGTNIKLGIIPVGSGNGLASNLNIPKEIDKAIAIIRKGSCMNIDIGKANEHFFFSNLGIGIDAMIIKKYEQAGKRTLMAYVKAAMSASFKFKTRETIAHFNNKIQTCSPFLFFISNSNEMGYNMSLTPKASLTDGWLDLVIIPQISFLKKLLLGFYVLQNRVENFKKASHILIKKLSIEVPDAIFLDVQIDGEYHKLRTNTITVSIIEKGLVVLC